MKTKDWIIPKTLLLSGYNNSSKITKGENTLRTFTEGVTRDTPLQVVVGDMAYNAILGRPWIHDMDAVPSILHHVIKFTLSWG